MTEFYINGLLFQLTVDSEQLGRLRIPAQPKPSPAEALELILKVARGNTNYDGWAEVAEAERVLREAIGGGE